MRKLATIVKREYLTRVRSKLFLFTTFGLPLLGVGYFFVIISVANHQVSRTMNVAILDQTGHIESLMATRLTQKLPNGQPMFHLINPTGSSSPNAEGRELVDEVRKGKLNGYLEIPSGVLTGAKAEFHTRNVGDVGVQIALHQALNEAVITERLRQRGVKVEHLQAIIQGADFQVFKVAKHGEWVEKGQTIVVGILVAMVLYMTLLIYGVTTARSVVEEKSTRMMELLVSSVRPVYLLTGKILGVGAVAMTQYVIWGISAALLLGYGAAVASIAGKRLPFAHLHVPAYLFVYAFLFFLIGYFLYASMFAAIGSLVSNEEDLQQTQLPVTLVIVGAVVFSHVVIINPNSPTSFILSEIPFFSPILMMERIALETPPFWQIALAFGLLGLTTLFIVKLSARIYRVGILMYGKRPSVVEIVRWLKYT